MAIWTREPRPAAYLLGTCGDGLVAASRAAAEFERTAKPVAVCLVARRVAELAAAVIDLAALGRHDRMAADYRGWSVFSRSSDVVRNRHNAVYLTRTRDPDHDFGCWLQFFSSDIGVIVGMVCEQAAYASVWADVEGVASYPWWDSQGPKEVPHGAWMARGQALREAMRGPGLMSEHFCLHRIPTVTVEDVMARMDPRPERARKIAAIDIVSEKTSAARAVDPTSGIDAMFAAERWIKHTDDGAAALEARAAALEARLADITERDVLSAPRTAGVR